MRYGLQDNEPLLLGTSGKNHAVNGELLRAFSMPILPFTSHINNTAIEALYTDYSFNWTLSLALFHVGDAKLLANIYRYQSFFLKLKYLKKKNKHVSRLLVAIHKE